MSGWNTSDKFCHWPTAKQLRAPKAQGCLVHVKVTDAELKESERLKHLDKLGTFFPEIVVEVKMKRHLKNQWLPVSRRFKLASGWIVAIPHWITNMQPAISPCLGEPLHAINFMWMA